VLRELTREDVFVLGSMLLTLGGIICGAIFAAPQAFGVTTLVVLALLVFAARVTASQRLAWLLVAGLPAGILELWADSVAVTYTHALVYTDYFGFRLLASPSYMPVGWWVTVIQFGYLALRLRERWPAWGVVAALSGLGVLLPPWYEQLAFPAHAWYYQSSGPMLSHTPLWIVGTYAACMFFIASAALSFYAPRAWGRAVLAGVFIGAGLLLSSVFWFSVLGR
jgi:hypothetical protein